MLSLCDERGWILLRISQGSRKFLSKIAEMLTVTVQTTYTLKELAYVVSKYGQRKVEPKTLYQWLPYALIPEPKLEYSERDAKKLVFLARSLNRIKSFELARKKLIQDIQTNPTKYEEKSMSLTPEEKAVLDRSKTKKSRKIGQSKRHAGSLQEQPDLISN